MQKLVNPKLLFINAVIFLFIFIFVMMFPMMHDDLAWSNINALANHTIFPHIVSDYKTWTGRISAQFLIYIFMHRDYNAVSVPVMAMITGFSFVVLVQISYRLIFLERALDEHLNRYMILVLLLIFYFKDIHSFVAMIGFKTISVQYLWGMVFAVWLLLNLDRSDRKDRTINFFIYGLLGLLIGLYNEMIFPCILFYFILRLNAVVRNRAFISYLIGLFVGFLILIAAPGNYIRKASAMIETHTVGVHYSLYEKVKILFSLYAHQAHFKIECVIVVGILLILAFILKQRIGYPLKLMLGAIFSLLILTPVAYYYNGVISGRVTFISDMLLFYALIYLVVLNFRALLPHWKWPSIHWSLLCTVMSMYFLAFLYAGYPAYQFNQARIALIKSTPDAIHHDFDFPAFCPDHINKWVGKGLIISAISPDPKSWVNTVYAQYYGAASVRELPCPDVAHHD